MVKNRLGRRVVVGMSVLGVLSLALLPLEHIHPSRTHDGRHPDVVHRHFEPHRLLEHHDTEPAFDHGGEDDARYLSTAFVSPQAASRDKPLQPSVLTDVPSTASLQLSRWTPSTGPVRVHDPPWRSAVGLRAPPSRQFA